MPKPSYPRAVGQCCARPVVTDFSGKGMPGSGWNFVHRYCAGCGAHEYGGDGEAVIFYTRPEWEARIEEANRDDSPPRDTSYCRWAAYESEACPMCSRTFCGHCGDLLHLRNCRHDVVQRHEIRPDQPA